jgi:transposase
MYATTGRASIPPERLLRALLLQIFYSVRSVAALIERLNYWTVTIDSGAIRRMGSKYFHFTGLACLL